MGTGTLPRIVTKLRDWTDEPCAGVLVGLFPVEPDGADGRDAVSLAACGPCPPTFAFLEWDPLREEESAARLDRTLSYLGTHWLLFLHRRAYDEYTGVHDVTVLRPAILVPPPPGLQRRVPGRTSLLYVVDTHRVLYCWRPVPTGAARPDTEDAGKG